METKKLILECSCGSELLQIIYDEEINQYYFAIFKYKFTKPSWKHRLKHIWHILRYGEPYDDNMVLSHDEMLKLVEFINVEKDNDTELEGK